jgi:hypothetical protein
MLRDDWKDFQKAVSRLVARAWLDDEFRQRFISNPAAVLAENGLTLPSGVQVRVNQEISADSITTLSTNTDSNVLYEIPLPPKPPELADTQLRSWSDANDTQVAVVGTL